MWAWLAAFVAKLLGVLLEPRNASATHEARAAGAAERELTVQNADLVEVQEALAARDRAVAAGRDGDPGADSLPDDGFRRD